MSLLGLVKKMDGITADKIREELLKYTEITNRFPNDDEFQKAFYTASLINKYSREILYCIALYQLNNDYTDNPKLNLEGFSVEHIMPKKWRNHWNHLPNESDNVLRDYVLLTLGNLTLVKGKLNSSMRDANWTIKKEALRKYSTLSQTTDYINIGDWNETEIASRAGHLYQSAIQIWKR